MNDLPYRPCVGIALFNSKGEVWVGQRTDMTEPAWQMPQGGIDEGEDPEAAAFRELEEEIGTSNAEVLGKTKDWLAYDLPPDLVGKVWKGRYRGQKQKWFALRFLGDDSEIDPQAVDHPEFDVWRWAPLADLPDLAASFKRDIYAAVAHEFRAFSDAAD